MSRDSDRGLMLDPGITALTLRALHRRDGHYPFLDRFRRRGHARRWAWPWRLGQPSTAPARLGVRGGPGVRQRPRAGSCSRSHLADLRRVVEQTLGSRQGTAS
jgi:hypothetical protein